MVFTDFVPLEAEKYTLWKLGELLAWLLAGWMAADWLLHGWLHTLEAWGALGLVACWLGGSRLAAAWLADQPQAPVARLWPTPCRLINS
jgi:hypothetical protein